MYLVQLLLPALDNTSSPFPKAAYAQVREALLERFGGLTAYTRSPATGLWSEEGDSGVVRDDIVVYEVMVESLDRQWWAGYRKSLEEKFAQQELVVRALPLEQL